MKRLLIWIVLLLIIAVPVDAMEFTAPTAPQEAQKWMPKDTEDFGEGLLTIIRSAITVIQPSLTEALGTSVSLVTACLLVGILVEFTPGIKQVVELLGIILVATLLFHPANAFIQKGTETVQEISQYGRLLLPVMTATLAAQGAVNRSGAIYLATAFFDALLSSAVSKFLVPLVYTFLCLSICIHLFGQSLLRDVGKFIKWLLTWGLKIILYVFTGYIGITSVVGGTTDAAMLKATKLTISGMVPVVGNILSDASEAVLVGAGVVKSTIGIYGLLVIIALWIGPFLQIGVQYLIFKITAGICEMFGPKKLSDLVKDYSSVMGIVLAMTGTICVIFLISIICFMKGIG